MFSFSVLLPSKYLRFLLPKYERLFQGAGRVGNVTLLPKGIIEG